MAKVSFIKNPDKKVTNTNTTVMTFKESKYVKKHKNLKYLLILSAILNIVLLGKLLF